MAHKRSEAERRLRKLQNTLRQKQKPVGRPAYMRRVPEDLKDDQMLGLTDLEHRRMLEALEVLLPDLRFEHLYKRGPFHRMDWSRALEAVWRFICLASFTDREDYVGWFFDEYAQEPQITRCFFRVLDLVVEERFEAGEATFVSPTDDDVPKGKWFEFPPAGTTGLVAAEVTGTQPGFMAERARATAEHAVRLLRVALRRHSVVTAEQLRFRVSHVYAFSSGAAGWGRPDDAAWGLHLGKDLQDLFTGQPVSRLGLTSANDIERRALIALGWFDRARLAADPIVVTLYNFFGLEALLGDRSEKLKGPLISFRRAVLAIATEGHFRHPDQMGWLYEQIRSQAVHGEPAPEIPREEQSRFNWDAWQAVNQVLELATTHGLTSRRRLVEYLDRSSEASRLLEWLRAQDPRWRDFRRPGVR